AQALDPLQELLRDDLVRVHVGAVERLDFAFHLAHWLHFTPPGFAPPNTARPGSLKYVSTRSKPASRSQSHSGSGSERMSPWAASSSERRPSAAVRGFSRPRSASSSRSRKNSSNSPSARPPVSTCSQFRNRPPGVSSSNASP